MATEKAIKKTKQKKPSKNSSLQKKIITLELISEIMLIGEVVGIEKELKACRHGYFVQKEATDSDELQRIKNI